MSFLFGGAKRRVEEDLERIRKANLPDKPVPPTVANEHGTSFTNENGASFTNEHSAASAGADKGSAREAHAGAVEITGQYEEPARVDNKTAFSLVIAVLSVILPYVGGVAVLLFAFWAFIQLIARQA